MVIHACAGLLTSQYYFTFSHMTLDLLINQVLEKDAAYFLQCETQSIEAGAAKT